MKVCVSVCACESFMKFYFNTSREISVVDR